MDYALTNRFYKCEKLCGVTRIDSLFATGHSLIAYPLRAVFSMAEAERDVAPARFLVSVPKKKLRRAVDRVLIRRRVREAYRLNRALLLPALAAHGRRVDVAFVYLSSSLKDYGIIEEKMRQLLERIAAHAGNQDGTPQENILSH